MKCKWVSVDDRLPERHARVLTLLFNEDKWLTMNSVQNRNIIQADGSIVSVFQWEEHNVEVTHWLEGVPELPEFPKKK